MKEKIYTIPLNDAVNAADECPFCFIERAVEQDLMDFVLGSAASYMEADVREETDKAGFCRTHFKKMFDYGNTLGNGWILKTHYMRTIKEMQKEFQNFAPTKSGFLGMRKKGTDAVNNVSAWIRKREESCYICNRFKADYERYLDTFFYLYDKDEEFKKKILQGKGFCLTHFGDLIEGAEGKIQGRDKDDFYKEIFDLMSRNMDRLQEDVSWLVEKFDYRNQEADWKNSKDAVQRGMQKLKGGYHADPVYKASK